MATLDEDYAPLLSGYDLAQLDNHEGAIYVLSSDWRLRYFNASWSRFAQDNGGEPAISQRFSLGASLFDALTPPHLRDFYTFHYAGCLTESRVWSHEYECSSASVFRRFRQFVYPLDGRGVLVVNSKIVERPHHLLESTSCEPTDRYRDAAGLIHQCAHCRRFRHGEHHASWDWVPAWVAKAPTRCSHGLCPTCAVFYYFKHLQNAADSDTASS